MTDSLRTNSDTEILNIGLLNDSFPPLIDGVANAVVNYAAEIEKNLQGHAIVITPNHPDASDSAYPFPVCRYPSIDVRKLTGYMAGLPFSPYVYAQLKEEKISLLHSHCPVVSTIIAREVREELNVPIVFTYHTKFDVDIAKIVKTSFGRKEIMRELIENISACDEVWTVSKGAGENLRSQGYTGDYIVMENGVDFEKGRVSSELIKENRERYGIPEDVPVYLFVGRLMWYKGLRIILNALAALNSEGDDFRMVFVGSGGDEKEVRECVRDLKLDQKVIFTGAVYDRAELKTWYCCSDVLLFPSSYDTNGLVVREAAACSVPAVLINNSCAAEGVTDGVNGYLIDENEDAMTEKLKEINRDLDNVSAVGTNAAEELYLSWHDAVARAYQRYQIVVDRYRKGEYGEHKRVSDKICEFAGFLMDAVNQQPFMEWHEWI